MQRSRWASNQFHDPSKQGMANEQARLASPGKIRSQTTKNCFFSHTFLNQKDKIGIKTYQSNLNTGYVPQKQFSNTAAGSPKAERTSKPVLNGLFKNSTTANLLVSSTQYLIDGPRTPTLISQASQKDIKPSQKTDSLRKPSFRDSGNSLATTNFLNSITSSGRTKLID